MATDLITKLEEAGEGSLSLDKEILAALGFTWRGMNYWSNANEMWPNGQANLTRSIDTALRWAERTLPGQEYEITTIYGVARVALNLNHGEQSGPLYGHNDCGNVALALCAAILRASEQERGG